jgi:hypothetical protein
VVYQIDAHCKRLLWVGEKRTVTRLPQLGAKKASNLLILRSWGRKGRHYKVMLVRPRGRRWR